ncbi:Hypothetical predicted protein [Pelobates cultripes]|uniref:Uncharacterized protein n=1 Tax=Pelobates cultripes TaxID=61616 RepID=A0AAD1TK20_PELCU|nr:Hypothetical predicted protein [Pelobates cultripes]
MGSVLDDGSQTVRYVEYRMEPVTTWYLNAHYLFIISSQRPLSTHMHVRSGAEEVETVQLYLPRSTPRMALMRGTELMVAAANSSC